MTRDTNATPFTLAVLVALAAIWGGAFTLIKVLVDDLTAVEMAAGRLTLGAIAVVALMQLRGGARLPDIRFIPAIAMLALLDTVIPYTLVGHAESDIDSGTASVLISAMPLFTTIFAAATLREERIGPARLAGIAAGFSGVMVLVGGGSFGSGSAWAEVSVVGAAASYGAGAVCARILLRRIDAISLTATKLAIGAVMATGAMAALGEGSGFGNLDAQGVAALAGLGVICTGISFAVYFGVVAAVGSVRASTVTYMIPVFGLLFGALFLDESIPGRTFGGMALIATGVAVVMYGASIDSAARRIAPWTRRAVPA